MTRDPLVSVVMPAYNAETTIAYAIQSVLNQTVKEIELVICEDASTDATLSVASSFKDPRIKIIRNEVNLGEGKSRDVAIQNSCGKWISVIDADDAWVSDRLHRLLLVTKDEPNSAVFDDLLICAHLESGESLRPIQPLRGRRAFGSKNGNAVLVPIEEYIRSDRLLIKPLFPASLVRGNRITHSNRTFGADTEYFIKLWLAGIKFYYLPEALYLYRVSPLSATSRASKSQMREMLEEVKIWREIPTSVRVALDNKISKLKSDEYVNLTIEKALTGDLIIATRMLLSHPNHFVASFSKILKAVRYRLRRFQVIHDFRI